MKLDPAQQKAIFDRNLNKIAQNINLVCFFLLKLTFGAKSYITLVPQKESPEYQLGRFKKGQKLKSTKRSKKGRPHVTFLFFFFHALFMTQVTSYSRFFNTQESRGTQSYFLIEFQSLCGYFSRSGKLTSKGAKQLRSLGKRLKTRYTSEVEHITNASTEGEQPSQRVCAFSSRTERTVESLRCLLGGLFEQEQTGPRQNPKIKTWVFDNADENWLLVPFKR